jgi:hypothetical protein
MKGEPPINGKNTERIHIRSMSTPADSHFDNISELGQLENPQKRTIAVKCKNLYQYDVRFSLN